MHVWKESEERFLIDLRLQRKVCSTKSHNILWGEIALEMKIWGVYVLPRVQKHKMSDSTNIMEQNMELMSAMKRQIEDAGTDGKIV
jgi:hypothetical protein